MDEEFPQAFPLWVLETGWIKEGSDHFLFPVQKRAAPLQRSSRRDQKNCLFFPRDEPSGSFPRAWSVVTPVGPEVRSTRSPFRFSSVPVLAVQCDQLCHSRLRRIGPRTQIPNAPYTPLPSHPCV